ncbi:MULTISPECIES: tetratricopeptide repeat protein [unclassified Microcoleus]|uniref:tetratricopeptide repeat protein n=1 Tax=unclassified Microcoleus TaxID=2642155 RepID=UPI002FD2E5BE
MIQNQTNLADVDNGNSAQKLVRDGEICRLSGEYSVALEKFKSAIELEPNYAWAHAHLGETYRQWGSHIESPERFFAEAKKCFETAISLDADYAWAYAHLGEAYRENLRYEEAEKNFKIAIDKDNHYAWAYAHRGANSYARGGDGSDDPYLAEALDYLTTALDKIPTYAWAKLYQAITLLEQNKDRESLEAFLSVISLDPSVIKTPTKDIALLNTNPRNLKTTFALFDKALSEHPDDLEIRYYHTVSKVKLMTSNEAKLLIDELYKLLEESNLHITLDELTKDYVLGGLAALEGNYEKAREKLATFTNNPKLKARAQRDLAWQPVFEGQSVS